MLAGNARGIVPMVSFVGEFRSKLPDGWKQLCVCEIKHLNVRLYF